MEEREKMAEKKQSATRDENGVKKQTYRRFKEGRDYTATGKEQTHALCDLFRRGFLQIEDTEQGGQVQRKNGRPRKIETVEEFTEIVERYINYIETKNDEGARLIPDIEGFCCFAGIARDTLNDWEKTRSSEYSAAIKRFKNAVAAYKKQLGLAGAIPPIVLAMDFNNNHGYTQQQTVEIQASRPLDSLPEKDDIIRRVTTKRLENEENAADDLEDLLN